MIILLLLLKNMRVCWRFWHHFHFEVGVVENFFLTKISSTAKW